MNLEDVKSLLEKLSAFEKNPLYKRFLTDQAEAVTTVEENILKIVPNSVEAVALLNALHGQRDQLIVFKDYFSGLRTDLEEELLQLEEGQTKGAKTTTED